MTDVTLRSFNLDTDAAAFLALFNRARHQNGALDRFIAETHAWPSDKTLRRLVATQGERLVGLAELRSFEYLPPDWLQLTLSVDDDVQGRGVGTTLLNWAEGTAAQCGAAGLGVNVRDHHPDSRAWAERRGYRLKAHRFASKLDLTAPQPLPEWPAGVQVRDMRAASPEEWDRLEVLYGDLLLHTPDLADQPRWTPARLRAALRDSPRMRPDWLLLAIEWRASEPDGQGWLGLCHGAVISEGVYNEFTAVTPEARGRGLARFLKLELIRRARAEGVPVMRTNNHASNTPMLRVNERLGFKRLAGAWELRKLF